MNSIKTIGVLGGSLLIGVLTGSWITAKIGLSGAVAVNPGVVS